MAAKKNKPSFMNCFAERRQLGMDIIFDFHVLREVRKRGKLVDYQLVRVKWYGYDDANWWNNVAPTDNARIRMGTDGRNYKIDFTTCEVVEVE